MRTDRLLFAALGGVLAVVFAVWMVAVTNAVWTLVIAVAIAIGAEVMVALVIIRELEDADGFPDPDDPRHAEYAPWTDDGR